jgi:hypothetical protein
MVYKIIVVQNKRSSLFLFMNITAKELLINQVLSNALSEAKSLKKIIYLDCR